MKQMPDGINALYKKIRQLVDKRFAIVITDKDYLDKAEVTITDPRCHVIYWVSFQADTIEAGLRDALAKLRYPKRDYKAPDGTIWKASERSVYGEDHIRGFLKENGNKE